MVGDRPATRLVNAQPPQGGVAGGQVELGLYLLVVDSLDGLGVQAEQRADLGEGLLGAAVEDPPPGAPVRLAVGEALARVGESQPLGEVALAFGAEELPNPHCQPDPGGQRCPGRAPGAACAG